MSVFLINNSSTIKKDDAMLKSFFPIFICLSLLAGCSTDAPVSSDLLQEETPTLTKTISSTSAVYRFDNNNEVGSSKLVRNQNGVSLTLNTSELEPGSAETVWWIVFNNPEECVDGCNGEDLSNEAVNGDVIYAAGNVVGGNGTANFAAHLNEGDNDGSIFMGGFGFAGSGLIDAETAEIHLVVRSHGQAIPGMIDEQIHTFNGGCPPNICGDVQFSIHEPPQ